MTRILPTLIALLLGLQVYSQTKYTISGYVRESGSQESLPGVAVVDLNGKNGTVTNNYGFYSLTIPADSVDLFVTYVGYQPFKIKFLLNKDTTITVDLGVVQLNTVVITDQQSERVSDGTQMSTVSIPVEQIKAIPALLGEKDVLKVVQLMPGVHSGNEGSSGFYVRGGGADQNLIILDDATVYNAYHLFGFFSIFNGDALKSVELTKGGFPARYGGRLSSVLEMQMKEGNKQEFHGEAGIGIISSRVTLEGPIIKGKSSFLVSGRRTYIDALIYPFLPPENKFGYFFHDFNAKLNYDINPNNRIYLSGYFGKDKFYAKFNAGPDMNDKAAMDWGNATATLRWNHLWTDQLFSNTSFIFTNYTLGIGYEEHYQNDDFVLKYSSGIRDFSLKHDFDFAPSPDHFIKFGVVSTYHRFNPSAIVIRSSYEPDNLFKQKILEAYESGIYVEDDWRLTDRLKVNFGFRLSHFNVQKKHYFRPEPRVAARYKIDENSSVKACFTIMNQYLHLLSNTGVGLPTDLWVPATANVAPQQSWQVAMGYARDIPKYKLMVTAEAYYKQSTDVLGYKDGASFLLVGDFEDGSEVTWENNVTSGTGESYGFEVLCQRKMGKLTGWVGYTLSWTWLQFDSINFGKKYYARQDRRNDISVVGIYEVNDNLTISATWVFGTGAAITLPLSEYSISVHDPVSGQQVTPQNNWQWFVNDYGEKNGFRMEAYHRMDIGVQHKKQMKYWERTFELSFYNLYNHRNPFFYYIGYDSTGTTRKLKQVSLFPIIPSVSWTIKF
jgi:hypothetical protein